MFGAAEAMVEQVVVNRADPPADVEERGLQGGAAASSPSKSLRVAASGPRRR